MRKSIFGVTLLSLAWLITPALAQKPAANPWAVHDATQTVAIKHAAYAKLLDAIVVDDGKTTQVAFAAITDPANQLLDQYITWMMGLPVSQLNRSEQLAYWLNLHNALTIREIAAGGAKGPIDRFRQFPISSSGPFAKPVVTVEGVPLSIEGIERDVLHANFSDFPYQYGLFLAAKGAPSLRREAYTGARVKDQLDDQARRFINNGGAHAKGDGLELSSFYDWWGADLRGMHASVREHIASYAAPKLAQRISAASDTITYRFDRAIPAFEPRYALDGTGGLSARDRGNGVGGTGGSSNGGFGGGS